MKPETYKAAIYRGIGNVDLVQLPYPDCGDDDVIVKNLLSGICGSDTTAYTAGGDSNQIWKDHEFGHEMVSEVVEVGKNITAVMVGDYVWPHLGHAHRDRKRMATVGGFSEYIKIVQYEEGYSAFPLDKSLPLEMLAIVEPFIIGTRGAKNADPSPDKTAVVFGAGLIGISAAIMLKYYGCEKVMIIDISDYRLAAAERFGLITCNSSKENLKSKAIETFGIIPGLAGEACGADIYIDCVGIQSIVDNFQNLAKSGATLVVVGVHHEPVTMNFMHLCYGQWIIKGCGTTPAGDAVKEILGMMKSNKFDLSSLVTHKYPLEKIDDALKMASNSSEAQKVVINLPT